MKDIHGVDLSSLDDFVTFVSESISLDDVTHGSQRNSGYNLDEDEVTRYIKSNSSEISSQVKEFISKALLEF